ncbi:MAG: hypothetical protein PVI99_08755 [Anaerolineales bacterium]|jgi:hypothetical protein
MTTRFQCSNCGDELEKNDFMVVIGKAPAQGLTAPIGRADAILDQIGEIYCQRCFQERYAKREAA